MRFWKNVRHNLIKWRFLEKETKMERTELHCRRIDIRGFRRRDGLFEVEGRIIDTKPHDIDIPFGRKVPATTPLHNLGMRLMLMRRMEKWLKNGGLIFTTLNNTGFRAYPIIFTELGDRGSAAF
jgi:hypothetical protein